MLLFVIIMETLLATLIGILLKKIVQNGILRNITLTISVKHGLPHKFVVQDPMLAGVIQIKIIKIFNYIRFFIFILHHFCKKATKTYM